MIATNGRFLYGANRLHDSIATFAIGIDGKLQHLNDIPTQGDYPRHIAFAPEEGFCMPVTSEAT